MKKHFVKTRLVHDRSKRWEILWLKWSDKRKKQVWAMHKNEQLLALIKCKDSIQVLQTVQANKSDSLGAMNKLQKDTNYLNWLKNEKLSKPVTRDWITNQKPSTKRQWVDGAALVRFSQMLKELTPIPINFRRQKNTAQLILRCQYCPDSKPEKVWA